MSSRNRTASTAILLNICKCLVIFYTAYYISSSICFALFRLQHFDGKIPFDFETWLYLPDCCAGFSSKQTVNFISMELSYAVSGLVFGLVVRERVWDYALTVTVFHIALSCLVMLNFPLSWSWWVCVVFGVLLMTVIGELVALVLRLKVQGKVAPEPSLGENAGFLFRKS